MGSTVNECGILPPNWELTLMGGSPCDLPSDSHTEHRTTLPNGDVYLWDGSECVYPGDCTFNGDMDCCVTFEKLIDKKGDDK